MELRLKPVALASEEVVLNGQRIRELNDELRAMRHGINNALGCLVPWLELLELQRPDLASTFAQLKAQPQKIETCVKAFTEKFEQGLGINRG
jgi:hypothetical protein